VQHLSAALGAFLSAQMLRELPDGKLVGMTQVALVSIGLAALLPPMLALLESQLRPRGTVPAPPDPETAAEPVLI
jgi:hypothetical protein